jgi:NAD(P)H dehydrogenase (quinone)
MADELFGVTGVTGAVGGRVARSLDSAGLRMRMVVRDRSSAPDLDAEVAEASDYGDGPAFRAAIEGVSTLFLVSGREHPERLRKHLTAVDAATAAGVGRIVYLSFLGAAPDATFTLARQHFATEEHIRAAGIPFTFLRSSLYLDYMPFLASADGVIAGPGGWGGLRRSPGTTSPTRFLPCSPPGGTTAGPTTTPAGQPIHSMRWRRSCRR